MKRYPSKEELLKQWYLWEAEIYITRRVEGWRVHFWATKTIRVPGIGRMKLKRRCYKRWSSVKEGWEYRYFLDEKIGIIKGGQFHPEVATEVRYLLKQGNNYENIANNMERYLGVKISRMKISKILTSKEGKENKEENIERVVVNRPLLYFNIDEGHVPIRSNKGRRVNSVRGRVVSAYTGREWDSKKKRYRLLNKCLFVELYPEGAIVSSEEYAKRLWGFINRRYDVMPNTVILGACDGAASLKKVVSLVPGAIPVLSKFHASRSGWDKFYLQRNKEGVRNWKRKDCLGYSAESDIAHVLKSRLGTGNRVYSLLGFKQLLHWQGVTTN